jgi:D-alanyl-D-alanine dipeptidase
MSPLQIEKLLSLAPPDSLQAILVISSDWDAVAATLSLYERASDTLQWQMLGEPFPVVTGKNGMAWGKGFHENKEGQILKKEGDHKAPAGIFYLTSAFGYAAKALNAQFPYIPITNDLIWVDDPASVHYNQPMHLSAFPDDKKDWQSAEIMLREDSLYRHGLVVSHNLDKPESGQGSCIFMHLWRNTETGTEGCTAMPEEDLIALIQWLDLAKKPVLVQLPETAVEEFISSQE